MGGPLVVDRREGRVLVMRLECLDCEHRETCKEGAIVFDTIEEFGESIVQAFKDERDEEQAEKAAEN